MPVSTIQRVMHIEIHESIYCGFNKSLCPRLQAPFFIPLFHHDQEVF